MQQLLKEHLAAYWPHKLNFILTEDISGSFPDDFWEDDSQMKPGAVWELLGLNNFDAFDPGIPFGDGELSKYLFVNGKTYASFSEGCKPMLRPMSDLNNRIDPAVDLTFQDALSNLCECESDLDWINHVVDLGFDKVNWEQAPYHLLSFLFKNHFDVFGLIGQDLAVDLNIHLEQQFYNEIMNDIAKDEYLERQNIKNHNDRIFRAILSFNGATYLDALKQLIEECEVDGRFSFARKPIGKYQTNDYTDIIKETWVDQYTGHECDDFYGTISVKLKNHLWLVMSFSC